MVEYDCITPEGVEEIVMRLDVIGEPNFFQQIVLFCGGTIKLKGWKIKRRRLKA